MKALSIKQPWAWAICNLPEPFKKDIENRTWDTNFRGEFLVHAGKDFDATGYLRMCRYLKSLNYEGEIPQMKEFIKGAIVGKANLVDTVKAHESIWFEGGESINPEIIGYVVEEGTAFKEPIEYKGQLRFFNVPDEIVKNVEYAYVEDEPFFTEDEIEEIYKDLDEQMVEKEFIDFIRFESLEAICAGCGCTDSHGCENGCSWIEVDPVTAFGFCSECEDKYEQFLKKDAKCTMEKK